MTVFQSLQVKKVGSLTGVASRLGGGINLFKLPIDMAENNGREFGTTQW